MPFVSTARYLVQLSEINRLTHRFEQDYTAHGHNLNFYVGGRQQSFRATASSLGKS
jgi:hypothetical protein